MSEHQHPHPPTAQQVVVAALAAPVPCAACGRTEPCRCYVPDAAAGRIERQAAVVVAALREYGHLAPEQTEPPPLTLAEVHETARWLATESRHPRYTTEGGWQRIMQSEADVDVAFAQAARHASNAQLDALNAARRLIVGWITEHGPEEPRG